jgi:hypothetical protein
MGRTKPTTTTGQDFYTQPSVMTSPGRHAALLTELPNEVGDLVRIIQHLVVYDVVAPEFYGFAVPEPRQNEIHVRSLEKMLDRIVALDDRPLSAARPIDKRLVGRCHHFVQLMVGILRSQGIPARARCGFGSYFNPPKFEDHWVCECWNATKARWTLVDVQFDDVWRTKLKIDHDILDVPRDRFLVAAMHGRSAEPVKPIRRSLGSSSSICAACGTSLGISSGMWRH